MEDRIITIVTHDLILTPDEIEVAVIEWVQKRSDKFKGEQLPHIAFHVDPHTETLKKVVVTINHKAN